MSFKREERGMYYCIRAGRYAGRYSTKKHFPQSTVQLRPYLIQGTKPYLDNKLKLKLKNYQLNALYHHLEVKPSQCPPGLCGRGPRLRVAFDIPVGAVIKTPGFNLILPVSSSLNDPPPFISMALAKTGGAELGH
jgi:hypothetical protein